MSPDTCPTTGSAADFLPRRRELPQLAKAAAQCQGCSLYCHATQVVFGEGPANAPVLFVGEQPGDQEDRAGRPFVGPAGRMLNESLAAAGIDRACIYFTNAVKHFKFTSSGKRRLHSKPTWTEIIACRPWLIAEITAIRPQGLILLGATAAQSLLGKTFKVTQHRGEVLPALQAGDAVHIPWVLATVHPSSLLRIPDRAARHAAIEVFVADLRIVQRLMKQKA